jgi:hypothetical protein
MMSRDRKTRPAMTNGWLADDITVNLADTAKFCRAAKANTGLIENKLENRNPKPENRINSERRSPNLVKCQAHPI